MHIRYTALASAALLVFAACAEAAQPGSIAEPAPTPDQGLYSPIDRSALALGLPDQIGPYVLVSATPEEIEYEEEQVVTDSRVRQLLVARGLGPSVVKVEQKSTGIVGPSTDEQIPRMALAAVQVKEMPAQSLVDWDPTFYLLLTSVDSGDYLWFGEKPDGYPQRVAEREVHVADFGRFKVGWYPYGDVLYVIVAEDDRSLKNAVERLPWSDLVV
jgi:hypothetical protein